MKPWRAIVLFLWALPLAALDPQKKISQFVHTSWSGDQVPTFVQALAQTADGYLWLGTASGLFRFDGVRFTPFEPLPGEKFTQSRIFGLVAAHDGGLWIVFRSGIVSHVFAGHVRTFSAADGLPFTWSLVEDRDGSLLAATAGGLTRFRNGRWSNADEELHYPERSARAVYLDRDGGLWVATEDRIVYRNVHGDHFMETGNRLVIPIGFLKFTQAPDGTMWLAETARSVHTVRPPVNRASEIKVGASNALFDRHGALWVTTIGDGLRRVPFPDFIAGRTVAQFGREAEQFTRKDGLSGDYALSSLEDREGNIWFGTARGLDRFRESIFTPFPLWSGEAAGSIIASNDGTILTSGTNSQFVQRIGRDGSVKSLTKSDGNVIASYQDSAGTVFIATRYGVDRFAGNGASYIRDRRVLDVRAMTVDLSGGLWMFDQQNGAFRFVEHKVVPIAGLPHEFVPMALTDRVGRIWIPYSSHLTVYQDGAFRDLGPADGLHGRVLAILEDHKGRLWLGGEGGLTRLEDWRFRKMPTEPLANIFGIAEDEDGFLWLAGDGGVVRLNPSEFDHAAADSRYHARYDYFNLMDGLPGRPLPRPTLVRAKDGHIWILTTDGLAFVDPHHIPKNLLPPPVQIESIRVDGKLRNPTAGMLLRPRSHDLEIDYTALSLTIPERVSFRYKLEGADTNWQDAGTRRQAYYNDLPPKRYRFRVLACNNDGIWSEAGASWDFSVAPAFNQTNWFYLLCTIIAVWLVWSLYRLRLSQMTARVNLRYRERLAERTRIARDLHDTLLQSLAGVSLQLGGIAKRVASSPELAVAQLDSVREQVECCFREARQNVWDLRSPALEDQGLPAALRDFLDQTRPASRVPCNFEVIGRVHPYRLDVEEHLMRIAQESVNNALRHAQASQVQLGIAYDSGGLRLSISDDGQGFDLQAACSKTGHWGLRNMRERAEEIGAQWRIHTGKGLGTMIEIKVPASCKRENACE